MSMLHWVRQKGRTNLVVFIHGLKGNKDTWRYDKETSFPSLLSQEESIANTHDIACFEYFTTFTNLYGKGRTFLSRFLTRNKKGEKNLPISEIAELLRGELITNATDYTKIVVIAHSMGGLITKSCFLQQIENDKMSKIKGFISLAVPHSGATIADLGGLISKNIQLKDLGVLSNLIDEITRQWIHTPLKPKCYYIYGTNDNIVNKKSALPFDATKNTTMAVNECHKSIAKPASKNETVYTATLKKILKFSDIEEKELTLATLDNKDQYNDDFFVIKLIVADVHERIQGHAKEYFYNAELSRKIFTSDNDRKNLNELYLKIKDIYQEKYELYLSKNLSTDELIASVHSIIKDEDKKYLNSTLSALDPIHKKGMIHQLANNCNLDIIWSNSTTMSSLSKKNNQNE